MEIEVVNNHPAYSPESTDFMRIMFTISLCEHLRESGLDVTGSNQWQVKVWTGVAWKSFVISIVMVNSEEWSITCPIPHDCSFGCSRRISIEHPFDEIVKMIRQCQKDNPHYVCWMDGRVFDV